MSSLFQAVREAQNGSAEWNEGNQRKTLGPSKTLSVQHPDTSTWPSASEDVGSVGAFPHAIISRHAGARGSVRERGSRRLRRQPAARGSPAGSFGEWREGGRLSLRRPPGSRHCYSHFPRCLSGSSRPGTVSAAGNPEPPESCCWTTGRSGTPRRSGSHPSASQGSEAGRTAVVSDTLSVPGGSSGSVTVHVPFSPPCVIWEEPMLIQTSYFCCKEPAGGGHLLGAGHCARPLTWETGVDASSGATEPGLEPPLSYFPAV